MSRDNLTPHEKDVAIMFLDVLLAEIGVEPIKRGRFWYFMFGDDNYSKEFRLSAEEARVITKMTEWKGK